MLEVSKGLVYRNANGKPGGNEVQQLLVPKQLVTEIIRRSHEGITGGHLGIAKTMDQVKRRFYWLSFKTMWSASAKLVQSATNTIHRVKLKRQGPLRHVLAGFPNERYYIDTTGPHRRSDRGNIYELTCIDALIKWGEAFPIRNREAETVAMVFVEQVFLRFGAPASVLIATKAKRSTET